MYIHAYDNELNYLGIKEVDTITVEALKDFEQELLLKYRIGMVNFDISIEFEGLTDKADDDLPF